MMKATAQRRDESGDAVEENKFLQTDQAAKKNEDDEGQNGELYMSNRRAAKRIMKGSKGRVHEEFGRLLSHK